VSSPQAPGLQQQVRCQVPGWGHRWGHYQLRSDRAAMACPPTKVGCAVGGLLQHCCSRCTPGATGGATASAEAGGLPWLIPQQGGVCCVTRWGALPLYLSNGLLWQCPPKVGAAGGGPASVALPNIQH
jgi:hypothetical protein